MNSACFLTHFRKLSTSFKFWLARTIHKVAYVSSHIYRLSYSMPIAGSLYAHTSERAYVKHRAENEKVLCKTERNEALFGACILAVVCILGKIRRQQ